MHTLCCVVKGPWRPPNISWSLRLEKAEERMTTHAENRSRTQGSNAIFVSVLVPSGFPGSAETKMHIFTRDKKKKTWNADWWIDTADLGEAVGDDWARRRNDIDGVRHSGQHNADDEVPHHLLPWIFGRVGHKKGIGTPKIKNTL